MTTVLCLLRFDLTVLCLRNYVFLCCLFLLALTDLEAMLIPDGCHIAAIVAWVAALPCYGALALGWKVASNIGADRSFSLENARLLKGVAVLAGVDSGLVFIVNAAFLLLNMNHPGVALLMLVVVLAGASVSVAAACLSHLVRKAAELQTENDLTI